MTCDEIQPEMWLAGLGNHGTRRVYGGAIEDFRRFLAIGDARDYRMITREHVMAWREQLLRRGLGQGTVRHRLAALSSFFEFLCENKIAAWNPVAGVKRPKNYVRASRAQTFDGDREIQPIWPVY